MKTEMMGSILVPEDQGSDHGLLLVPITVVALGLQHLGTYYLPLPWLPAEPAGRIRPVFRGMRIRLARVEDGA